jgi:hypothetical protein
VAYIEADSNINIDDIAILTQRRLIVTVFYVLAGAASGFWMPYLKWTRIWYPMTDAFIH